MNQEIFTTKKDIKDTNIALISDIHYHPKFNNKIFDKVLKQIKNSNIDYITIVGDLIDSSDIEEFSSLKNFLENLTSIAPTIVVLGNHEEKAGYIHHWEYYHNEEFIKMLKSINNLYLLDDSTYSDKNITFYGINLSYNHYNEDKESYESFYKEMKKLKQPLNSNKYNITLIHSPLNIYTYLEKNPDSELNKSDLILSGHMHNGCAPSWFAKPFNKLFKSTRSLIAPSKSLFPKFAQGRYYKRDGYIYQGLSKLSYSTRFFHIFDSLYSKNITIITIKKDA